MNQHFQVRRVVRFGVYEVDLRAGELRKNGLKIKLQGQPFQILSMLLEQPGELVTREELRQRLWPSGTTVDFEHSLNTSVKKLREALGDEADNPRFVETLHRRGYRFVAPVSGKGANGLASRESIAERARSKLSIASRRMILAIISTIAIVGVAFLFGTLGGSRQPVVTSSRPITSGSDVFPSDRVNMALPEPDFIFRPGSEAAQKSIERYCRDIDVLTSQVEPAVLVADDVTPTAAWRRVQRSEWKYIDLSVPSALAWTREGEVVAVRLWTPDLGKAFNPVSYCFRTDGSIARIMLETKRSPPKLRKTIGIGREWFFDADGTKIFEAFHRHDASPLKSETTYHLYPPIVRLYKDVRDLPFLNLVSQVPAAQIATY